MSHAARYLLDTTALIDFSKGFEPPQSNILQLIDQGLPLAVCAVSVTEPAGLAAQVDRRTSTPMAERFRRVVTGLNAAGKSIIAKDTEIEPTMYGVWPQIDFWKTTSIPASLTADADTLGLREQIEPPANGTIFRMLEIPPIDPSQTPAEAEKAAEESFAALNSSNLRQNTDLNPMMHTTASLDYVIVLRGEITLLVDDGRATLHPFDVVVQRGTNHYWINESTESVLMMGVMLDAK